MRTMRDRATAAGLSLRIDSAPGAGATVTVEAPCRVGVET
jgi:signal transduction histidine kinase